MRHEARSVPVRNVIVLQSATIFCLFSRQINVDTACHQVAPPLFFSLTTNCPSYLNTLSCTCFLAASTPSHPKNTHVASASPEHTVENRPGTTNRRASKVAREKRKKKKDWRQAPWRPNSHGLFLLPSIGGVLSSNSPFPPSFWIILCTILPSNRAA